MLLASLLLTLAAGPVNYDVIAEQSPFLIVEESFRGSLCPTGPWEAYATLHEFGKVENPATLRWVDPLNPQAYQGELLITKRWPHLDLIRLRAKGGEGFRVWYPIAKEMPPRGTELVYRVLLADLSLLFSKAYYAGPLRRAPGQIVTRGDSGAPGSSGACVVTLKGETIGVHLGSARQENRNPEGVDFPFFYDRAVRLVGLK